MSAANNGKPADRHGHATNDPLWVRVLLIGGVLTFLTVMVLTPIAFVFVQAFSDGVGPYFSRIVKDPDNWSAVRLTLLVSPIAVGLNLVFGIAAAWLIARFKFYGREFLIALVDLPFAVSPVVVGLSLIMLYGVRTPLGAFLAEHNVRIIFAFPAIVLATTFVTVPFVARELIPVMEAVGEEEEVAALSLGASAWQMFWYVTLPNIKWGVLYGVLLCNARAMGEFGAVYVVSGRVSGVTDTMPLRVEKLDQEFRTPESYALASVLTSLALVTLFLKVMLERRVHVQAKPEDSLIPPVDDPLLGSKAQQEGSGKWIPLTGRP